VTEGAEGTPRWVRLFLAVALTVVLVGVVLVLLSGGRHGPGRHLSMAETGSVRGLAQRR
jgi:hypothetical protein